MRTFALQGCLPDEWPTRRLDSELLWLAEEGLYAPVPEVSRVLLCARSAPAT